jgi:hypothetical protein
VPREEGGPEDALRRLEERVSRASEAAERLLGEAARSAADRIGEAADAAARVANAGKPDSDPRQPPPAGWQLPEDESPSHDRSELDALLGVLHSLRDLIPPDLQRRLAEAVRELLLALRALIDWYLERLERRRAEPTEVQDIPIL